MAKRWKVNVSEWNDGAQTALEIGSYREVYSQLLDTLDSMAKPCK